MGFAYFLLGALLGAQIVVVCWIHSCNKDLERIEKCMMDEISLEDDRLCEMYDQYLAENEDVQSL